MNRLLISILSLLALVFAGQSVLAEQEFVLQDGPALKERKELHKKIQSAKEKGIGIKSYMQFLTGIEERVKKGEDEKVILEQVKRIDDGLSKQLSGPEKGGYSVNSPRPINAYLDKIESDLSKKFKPIGEAIQTCKLTCSLAEDGKVTEVKPHPDNIDDKKRTEKAIKHIKAIGRFPKPPKGASTIDLVVDLKGTSVSSSVNQDKISYGPYMAYLQAKIKRRWFPPKENRSKRVTVYFKVARNGAISDLKLPRSSGVVAADRAALKAVQTSHPMPALPDGSPQNVDIHFTFDYNVFKSGRSRYRRF